MIARSRAGSFGFVVALGMFGADGTARADASVAVQLKDARGALSDGTVTLLDAESTAVASCKARQGTCEMKNVAGGNYSVTVQTPAGDGPKPRKVTIPPSGKVTLVVTSS